MRYLKNSPSIDFSLYVLGTNTGSKYDKIIEKEKLDVTYVNISKKTINIKGVRRLITTRKVCNAVNKIITYEKPDIVHFHISKLLAHAYSIVKKYPDIVFFDTLHSDPYIYRGLELSILKRCFNKYAVTPICVTDYQLERAKQRYQLSNVELVRNSIEVEKLKNSGIKQTEAKKMMNIAEDTYVIAGIGRLNSIKRFDFLLEVFSKLKEQKENSVLLLAGTGPEKFKLEELTKNLNISDSVIFLGMVDDIIKVYSALDVLAVTSISESCSLVALEAQALGKRCVISNGVPESVIVTDLVSRMPEQATIEEWKEALLGNWATSSRGGLEFDDYDIDITQSGLEKLYIKYYEKN